MTANQEELLSFSRFPSRWIVLILNFVTWLTKCACGVLMRAQSAVPAKHAEHTHQELRRTLGIRVRN
jgi:hypothetical protein